MADFISHLPDHIICLILSFLPTKQSVVTSTLSKRWRPLWAHVPTLDLHSGAHHPNFPATVDHVLSLHEASTLESFSLYQENSTDFTESELENWITLVTKRNVKIVELNFDSEIMVKLPKCLFTCRTLVDLRLEICAMPTFTEPLSLPSLKRLYLCLVQYEVNYALPWLLEGCPVLEELTVSGIANALDQLIVASDSLRSLELELLFDNVNCFVLVDAPGLRWIKVNECSYLRIGFRRAVNYLVEAEIGFNDYMFQENEVLCAVGVLCFMQRLSGVRRLKLSGSVEEFPDLPTAQLYVSFSNLVSLELATDWRIIPKIFKSAENLEILIIHKGYENLKRWSEAMEGQCACILYSLKTVVIYEFGWTDEELEVVQFILGNAGVLRKMEICSSADGNSPETRLNMLEIIQSFHLQSVECKLVFTWED
ncbi:F-box/RNI-like/FBD-like domains-containing protein [Striga asiatica]|uniref:F-box/RNI-like/FBD-like domains-containing protein n=1 Tax=Striga asiatica TaxID=4170 RepID=A0A5A7PEC9_STRAF|nr:F-box/RNI-like/FBD-like domains-containing protein [Striga asiatica]